MATDSAALAADSAAKATSRRTTTYSSVPSPAQTRTPSLAHRPTSRTHHHTQQAPGWQHQLGRWRPPGAPSSPAPKCGHPPGAAAAHRKPLGAAAGRRRQLAARSGQGNRRGAPEAAVRQIRPGEPPPGAGGCRPRPGRGRREGSTTTTPPRPSVGAARRRWPSASAAAAPRDDSPRNARSARIRGQEARIRRGGPRIRRRFAGEPAGPGGGGATKWRGWERR